MDYLTQYALLAKKRQYKPVKPPRAWDHPLTWPVLAVVIAAALIIAWIQIFGG